MPDKWYNEMYVAIHIFDIWHTYLEYFHHNYRNRHWSIDRHSYHQLIRPFVLRLCLVNYLRQCIFVLHDLKWHVVLPEIIKTGNNGNKW